VTAPAASRTIAIALLIAAASGGGAAAATAHPSSNGTDVATARSTTDDGPTPATPAGTGGYRISTKPVVYEPPPKKGNAAQFEVALRLNKSLQRQGIEGYPQISVLTPKRTLIAVDDRAATSFARPSRHCYASQTPYDHTSKRHTKPGDVVRIQLDFFIDQKLYRVTRLARVKVAREANSRNGTVFHRVAARSLNC
jgi:hypothetical protein